MISERLRPALNLTIAAIFTAAQSRWENYIGPAGPGGGEKDREVVSVDSRLLIARFVDPDAAKRYGYMVYVRCT
jgi:hypothetical protein